MLADDFTTMCANKASMLPKLEGVLQQLKHDVGIKNVTMRDLRDTMDQAVKDWSKTSAKYDQSIQKEVTIPALHARHTSPAWPMPCGTPVHTCVSRVRQPFGVFCSSWALTVCVASIVASWLYRKRASSSRVRGPANLRNSASSSTRRTRSSRTRPSRTRKTLSPSRCVCGVYLSAHTLKILVPCSASH